MLGMPRVSSITRSEIRTEVGEPCKDLLAGQRAGSLERGPGGHDPVDQAVGEGLVGGDAAAGKDHLGSHLRRDGTRQPDETPCARDQADSDIAERELSCGVGHDQVAGQCDLAAAAHGEAVDRGDDGLGDVRPAGDGRRTRSSAPTWACPTPSQTRLIAGREGLLPRPGEDGDPQVVVGEVGVEDVIEFVVGHRVQAVPRLGPVDGDLEQVVVPARLR